MSPGPRIKVPGSDFLTSFQDFHPFGVAELLPDLPGKSKAPTCPLCGHHRSLYTANTHRIDSRYLEEEESVAHPAKESTNAYLCPLYY